MLAVKETNTKQIDLSIEKNLHNNNDIMKPHMFQRGKVVPVILDGTIYDILEYWNEDARVREGFQTEYDTKTVYVPNFFVKINGEFESRKERKKLKKTFNKNSLIINSLEFTSKNLHGKSREIKKINKIFKEKYDISIETIKEEISSEDLENSIINTLNIYQANYVINKLSYFIRLYMDNYINDDNIMSYLLYNVMFMDDKIVKLLQEWDYPYQVPKIVFYDKYKNSKENSVDYIMMHFLNYLGMDIAVISPSGRASIESFGFKLKDTVIPITLDKLTQLKTNPKKKLKITGITAGILVSCTAVVGVGILVSKGIDKIQKDNTVVVEVKPDEEVNPIVPEPQQPEVSDDKSTDSAFKELSENTTSLIDLMSIFMIGVASCGMAYGLLIRLISHDYVAQERGSSIARSMIMLFIAAGIIKALSSFVLPEISAIDSNNINIIEENKE